MMRVEAPRQFLPNVRSSGLVLRLTLAKGMNSEQIWPNTRNFSKLKLMMFHVRVFLLDALDTKMLVSCQSEQYWKRYSRNIALELK